MSSAITVNVVHAAVTGAFATTAKGLLRNALRGGTAQKLLQFCLVLRKNRRSRHSLTQLKAAATEKKPPTMVHDIFVTVPCPTPVPTPR